MAQTVVGIFYDINGKVAKMVTPTDDSELPEHAQQGLTMLTMPIAQFDATPDLNDIQTWITAQIAANVV